MKLPADATISPLKVTHYLLLPQSRSDKSRYLARAGYTLANVERVIADLRAQSCVAADSTRLSASGKARLFLEGAYALAPQRPQLVGQSPHRPSQSSSRDTIPSDSPGSLLLADDRSFL